MKAVNPKAGANGIVARSESRMAGGSICWTCSLRAEWSSMERVVPAITQQSELNGQQTPKANPLRICHPEAGPGSNWGGGEEICQSGGRVEPHLEHGLAVLVIMAAGLQVRKYSFATA